MDASLNAVYTRRDFIQMSLDRVKLDSSVHMSRPLGTDHLTRLRANAEGKSTQQCHPERNLDRLNQILLHRRGPTNLGRAHDQPLVRALMAANLH